MTQVGPALKELMRETDKDTITMLVISCTMDKMCGVMPGLRFGYPAHWRWSEE